MAHRAAHATRGRDATILWMGPLTASAYWVFETVVHSVIFDEGTIAQHLLPADSHELWMRSFVCLLFIAFGVFAHAVGNRMTRAQLEQQRLQMRLEEALTKVLSGFLPICGSCKRIRVDDSEPERDSSWHRVEYYLTQRTDLDLTHSICPPCERKLYGEHLEERSEAFEI